MYFGHQKCAPVINLKEVSASPFLMLFVPYWRCSSLYKPLLNRAMVSFTNGENIYFIIQFTMPEKDEYKSCQMIKIETYLI